MLFSFIFHPWVLAPRMLSPYFLNEGVHENTSAEIGMLRPFYRLDHQDPE